jgi:hypothetical protein
VGYEVSLKAWRGRLKEVRLTGRNTEGSHDSTRHSLAPDWACVQTTSDPFHDHRAHYFYPKYH